MKTAPPGPKPSPEEAVRRLSEVSDLAMKLSRLGREAGLHRRPERHQTVREGHPAYGGDAAPSQWVLLLEDDPERMAAFHEAVREWPGTGVLVACVPETLLDQVEQTGDQVTLIALDDDLDPLVPGGPAAGHGMDVCRALAARPPGPPVVLHAKAGGTCDRMRSTLEAAGWRVAVVHPEGRGVDWVKDAWLPRAMAMART